MKFLSSWNISNHPSPQYCLKTTPLPNIIFSILNKKNKGRSGGVIIVVMVCVVVFLLGIVLTIIICMIWQNVIEYKCLCK